jgi:phosphoribosylformylglycinamidine synthase
VALAECCMMGDRHAAQPWIGAAIRIPFGGRKDFVLFGEDPSRIVISCPPDRWQRVQELAREAGAPLVQLGAVGGSRLEIQGALSVAVEDLANAWRDGVPRVLRRASSHFVRAAEEKL